jgi:hypothetical protein
MECCHSYWCNYRAAHNFFSAAFNDDLYNTFWARISIGRLKFHRHNYDPFKIAFSNTFPPLVNPFHASTCTSIRVVVHYRSNFVCIGRGVFVTEQKEEAEGNVH